MSKRRKWNASSCHNVLRRSSPRRSSVSGSAGCQMRAPRGPGETRRLETKYTYDVFRLGLLVYHMLLKYEKPYNMGTTSKYRSEIPSFSCEKTHTSLF